MPRQAWRVDRGTRFSEMTPNQPGPSGLFSSRTAFWRGRTPAPRPGCGRLDLRQLAA